MNDGVWLGHHEGEGFVPASLAKVPVVVACLRQAQATPSFLARTVRYEGLPAEREPGFMNPEVNLEQGRAYDVAELIERVGRYSDNAAARLLAATVDPALLALESFARSTFELGLVAGVPEGLPAR